MINADELLNPISDDKPCGEDLSYDQGFQELESLIRGKPETQFSAAEDPDWKVLREHCLELWSRSKDLRLATALTLATVKMDGLPALHAGLTLIKGMLDKYWDTCYPLLDPADNNDPTQRLNIIASLATPVGTFGDPMRFLERLRQAPLASSRQMGQFSMADILVSEAAPAATEDAPATGPTAAQIEAAFRDTPPEHLAAVSQTVADCLRLINEIDQWLTSSLGSDRAPDLEALPRELKEIQKRLAIYMPAGSVPASADSGTPAAGASAAGAASKPIEGEIQSREDVVRMIDKICDFYKRAEPSSPVPNILRRAQRLAAMDFMEIMNDLSPESVKEIQRITGEVPKEG